jgi:RNA polymerase sigma-70 factor (ECF subfamily)
VDDPPGPTTPERELVTGELRTRVREAIDVLPVKQRVAMMLFALEDMGIAETAYAMGCSAGTVKAHLHRARHKLAADLSAYMEEDE